MVVRERARLKRKLSREDAEEGRRELLLGAWANDPRTGRQFMRMRANVSYKEATTVNASPKIDYGTGGRCASPRPDYGTVRADYGECESVGRLWYNWLLYDGTL